MISNHVHIRTSDSHPIYDMETKKRLNPSRSVLLGNHIWIAPQSAVYKGVCVGDGSIIASRTLVTHDVPSNVVVAGLPAKVVKTNVFWSREDVAEKKIIVFFSRRFFVFCYNYALRSVI
jgi:acetyltransferase-like isoleucine patch superfamily enzyme